MRRFAFVALMLTGITSCDDAQKGKITSGITTGEMKLGVDHSFQLLMDAETYVYTSLNTEAKIHPRYLPESDVISQLMDDSIQCAVTARPLNEEELKYFKARNRYPESIPFAWDAVTLIVHPANADTSLTLDQVKAIFSGQITNWNKVNNSKHSGDIKIVFDNNKSSNARYIKEVLLAGAPFPENCFAVQNNEEVINFVGENKNALGVIGLNWISDNQDKQSQKFAEKIKVVGITNPAAKDTTKAYKPFQAYVWDKSYPLTRQIYFIQAGAGRSLGTGFVNHLLTEKGQQIIDRIGMVPVTPTTRIIRITE